MRIFRYALILIATLATPFCSGARAGVIGDALLSFPTRTEYVEDDNLAALRSLPYYGDLQGRFSGKALDEAHTVLNQLGVPDAQVEEVVTGSNANLTYGVATGTFSTRAPRSSPASSATKPNCWIRTCIASAVPLVFCFWITQPSLSGPR